MDNILTKLNSPMMYLICGSVIAFVALVSLIFMIRAYKAGKAVGIDEEKMKRIITFSATFTVLPAIGILLGVIALSGSLGIPWPWLRLSVIGALHYETQVASVAAEQVGMSSLSANEMTAGNFTTIALLMSLCIVWGIVLSIFFNKGYLKKISGKKKKENNSSGFGDLAMTAMFIGLVSTYIGSYIGSYVSSEGLFTFKGYLTPIVVALVSGITMAVFMYFTEKKKMKWLEGFSVAGSMLAGMLMAVIMGA